MTWSANIALKDLIDNPNQIVRKSDPDRNLDWRVILVESYRTDPWPRLESTMRYDDILRYLGDFGRYQKYMYFTICLLAIPCAWHSLGNTFLSAQPEHYCRTFPGQEYEEFSPTKNCTIPYKNQEWEKCERYNRTAPYDQCDEEGVVLGCDKGWVYDTTFYESTAVTEVRQSKKRPYP